MNDSRDPILNDAAPMDSHPAPEIFDWEHLEDRDFLRFVWPRLPIPVRYHIFQSAMLMWDQINQLYEDG